MGRLYPSVPDWHELSDQQRSALEGMASTFGFDPTLEGRERVNNLILPTKKESFSIALEMYTMSCRAIDQFQNGK